MMGWIRSKIASLRPSCFKDLSIASNTRIYLITCARIYVFRRYRPIKKVMTVASGSTIIIASRAIKNPLIPPYFIEKINPPRTVSRRVGRASGTHTRNKEQYRKKPWVGDKESN